MLEYEYRLDDTLELMARNGNKHFSPHFVCSQSGIADLEYVSRYLLMQVGRKLKISYEVECPEGDSDFAVKNLQEISDEKRKCSVCGTNYKPSPEKVWISFEFLPNYLDYVKKSL